ncbi:MAG: hypothetical protein COC12_09220 [Rhodobacteraceae bacterium]|nr:MAG: hypothetical protein COC12_09220 [Paracoccaceae bacterium]
MTMISTTCPGVTTKSASTGFSVIASLSRFHAVWTQRKALKSLDSAALQDIGVTRAQAQAEAKRPVWDAPESWHC